MNAIAIDFCHAIEAPFVPLVGAPQLMPSAMNAQVATLPFALMTTPTS